MSVTITLSKLNLRSAKTRQLQSSSNTRIRQWSLNSVKSHHQLTYDAINKINICTSGQWKASTDANNSLLHSLSDLLNAGYSLTHAMQVMHNQPSSHFSGIAQAIINNTEALRLNSDTQKLYYGLSDSRYGKFGDQIMAFQESLHRAYPNSLSMELYDINNNNSDRNISSRLGIIKKRIKSVIQDNPANTQFEIILTFNGELSLQDSLASNDSINSLMQIALLSQIGSLTVGSQSCQSRDLNDNIQKRKKVYKSLLDLYNN